MSKVTYDIRNDAPHQVFSAAKENEFERGLPYAEKVKRKLQLNCILEKDDELVFDLIGVDVSIANALRRIMLAEVPTMAIETVYMEMNTSVIFDEVLAHRLGLVPLDADPRLFTEVIQKKKPTVQEFTMPDGEKRLKESNEEEEYEPIDENNTIVFTLNYKCKRPSNITTNPDGTPYSESVLSGHFNWVPQGEQDVRFPQGIKPLHPDILLAKLRPGQEIVLEMHCRKGIGKDHAKYSPVATASYRLQPRISFLLPVQDDMADDLVETCPMKVFDIEDIGGKRTATVARPRNCSMCRECIRPPGWSDYVKLERISDHFIFSIESAGALQPRDILKESVRVLREKCTSFVPIVDEMIYRNATSKK